MMMYKVCIATSKQTGKTISGITHIVETDEEPKEYSLENERYYFDYKFFNSEAEAKQYIKSIEKGDCL